MPLVNIRVIGNNEFFKKVEKAKKNLIPVLAKAMARGMYKMADWSRANRLSGNPLKNRTGTLRRSINSKVSVSEEKLTGTIGTPVFYGEYHELGGVFQIPAHTRMQTHAWGHAIEPRQVNVRAHQAKFPQRAFLRPALDAKRDEVLADMRNSVVGLLS